MKAVLRRKDQGQSLPLIALMIVLLFAMVGLSVDVGNTYAEQRTAHRATNAAAIAGIDAVIKGYDDASIAQIIKESMTINGVHLLQDGGDRSLRAYYMDVAGNTISNCEIGSCAKVPDSTIYVQVTTEGVVNTSFARVVGRPTLPVNSTSWAGRCTPTNGVYPLAIWSGDIKDNDFIAPTGLTQTELAAQYGGYEDGDYSGKHWFRIKMKDNPPGGNGNFMMMNWEADQNWGTPELVAAFDGDGNLGEGFKEAAWPDKNANEMPTGYPLKPGQLSAGDLIATTPGQKFATSLKSTLQTLMNEKTVLMLPIVDKYYGSGSNYVVRVARIGKFYIVDPFPNDPNNGGIGEQGGINSYIDMVYLGEANESACAVTNIDPRNDITKTPEDPRTPTIPPTNPTIRIPFQVNPRWTGQDVPTDPIAYQLVVDVSGSMSWDFYGNGSKGGTVRVGANTTGSYTNKRCEWSAPANAYPYDDACSGGIDSSWWNFQQRRIYVTKSAIRDFINDLRPNDVMRYTAFSSGSYSGNTKVVPATGFTGDKVTLLGELDTLGAYANDPYRTNGGTPGPQALAKARDVLASAPALASNGQSFRNVVIYLTDGVANVYLNGTTNYARDICAELTRTQAINTPDPCQVGYSTVDRQNRPITEMINQANKIKTDDPKVQIYTIALAGVATDGLEKVASSSSMLYKANEPGFVGTVLNAIRERTLDAKCLSQGGSGYIDRIPAANHTDITSPSKYVLGSDEYGKVTLYNEAGTAVVATGSIKHDSFSGKLGVELNVPPGNYLMEAWVGYKGPDQPVPKNRVYTALSWNQVSFSDRLSVSVLQDGSLNSVTTLPTVYVDLPATQNVCTS